MIKNAFPLVSIIVPIYNVEDYIEKCVKSLLAQSYISIEIVLVNDGSTDESGHLSDTFAANDPRVKVIHKKNGGVSSARNVGLECSTGSLVCYVDGDDYVSKNYVSIMYGTMKNSGADIVECAFYRVVGETHSKVPSVPESLDGIGAIKRMLMSNDIGEVVAWGKLYSKRLFQENNIKYPVGKISEDVYTTYKLFSIANKIVFTEEPLYYYVKRDTSLTSVSFSRNHLDGVEATDEIIFWAKKHHPELKEVAYASRARMSLYFSGEIYKLPKPDSETLNSFTLWIRSNWHIILQNKFIPYKQKLSLMLLALGGSVYLGARKVYEIF
jgi:glycosyltransferase involved in cell wall biosynthesis